MPDDIPPAPSETDESGASKAETIRITLPSGGEQPVAKRETVRINLPGKPASTMPPPAGVAPKKETTKIGPLAGGPPAPAASAPSVPPSSGAKPFVPPPPRPPSAPSAPGAPLAPMKPMSGVNPPPKPPSLAGARPTVPLKPAPATSAPGAPVRPAAPVGSGLMTPEPMTQKAAAPKKETARITLPGEGARPSMPKATVKMQQTQPLVSKPAPSLTSASVSSAPVSTSVVDAEPDSMVSLLSMAALVISLISLGLVYWAYSATALS